MWVGGWGQAEEPRLPFRPPHGCFEDGKPWPGPPAGDTVCHCIPFVSGGAGPPSSLKGQPGASGWQDPPGTYQEARGSPWDMPFDPF